MTIEFDGQNNKLGTTTANSVTIKTNDTDAITVDSSGNVGIGTSSPSNKTHITSSESGTTPVLRVENSNSDGLIGFKRTSGTPSDDYVLGADSTRMYFRNNTTSSDLISILEGGSVGIGTSSPSGKLDVVGDIYWGSQGNGRIFSDSNWGCILRADRASPAVAEFMWQNASNTERMRINSSGNVKIANGIIHGGGGGIGMDTFRLEPTNSSGTKIDNTNDVGSPTYRWDDIYATSGTVNTSDQNEKQSIQSLTASEMAVAQRISKLFKTYKWNSAVEKKGDNARTHTGVIAQDVQQAFADEGLDAGNYGMFISGTWWEKEISVDAVAEQLDEEGNVLVEGKDAYTYTDIKEEATEGYTERTRLGIRYPELLSFVSSAFEQRLTNIETRLEALENV